MKFVDTFKRSSRNLRTAKLRTLLTALAISVGGFTLCLTLAASQGARDYTDRLINNNFDPDTVFVAKDESLFSANTSPKPREYSPDLASSYGLLLKQFDSKDVAKIEALPHVKDVIQNYDVTAQFITRPVANAKKYTGALNVYDSAQKPEIKAGTAPDSLGGGNVLMADNYINFLGFKSAQDAVGQTIQVQVRQPTGATMLKSYKVAGVTTKSSLALDFAPVGLYVSEDEARVLNNFVKGGTVNADQVPTVLVRGDGIDPAVLKQSIEKLGFEARTAKDLQEFLTQIINILSIIIVVFGAITLVASFFGVVNTQYISVLERTREIGLMKALGMSRGTVLRLFMIEATWIGFIGAGLGSLGAFLLGQALNPWISDKINFGKEQLLVYKPGQIIGLILFLMLVTTLAGVLPARKAAKLDPIEALRTE